jgi:peptidoglycan LD-endopeptidase LytH
MFASLTGLKPGWYLLIALLAFAVASSVGWRSAVVDLREARLQLAGAGPVALVDAAPPAAPAAVAGELANDVGLWFPIPGAGVPSHDDHLPGAPRPYRAGVSEGFVFWPDGAGVPLAYGTPVVASGSGQVIRVDEPYAETDQAAWEALLASVADGADDRELDQLRGRQVWIRLDDGRVLRYGHLSGVRAGLRVGDRVARGRVVAFVGNSGTLDGVVGRTTNARLHFEIRDGDGFVGEGLDAEGVRWLAASLFTGP